MRGAILGIAVLSATLTLVAAPGIAGQSARRHWCPQIPRFTAYWAGRAVGVHRVTYADVSCYRRGRGGEPLPADGFVSFLYGDCHDYGNVGCRLPVEIQSKPLCSNRPAVYGDPYSHPDRWGRMRGVPTAYYRNDRLELYTRTTTIVVFARKPSLMRKAAKRVHVPPRYDLPRRGHPRKKFRREPHPRRHYGRLPAPTRHQMRTKKSCG